MTKYQGRRAFIRDKALGLLEEVEIWEPYVDVELIARHLSIKLIYAQYEGDVSGFLAYNDDDVVIGINSLHNEKRQRFTIGHEIGHFMLHGREFNFVDHKPMILHRDARTSLGSDKKEVEANQFAAELLMPRHMIDGVLMSIDTEREAEVVIDELADEFRVSRQAMTLRLMGLGYITETDV